MTEEIPLWDDDIPHAVGEGPGHIPTLIPFLPEADKATGTAVIVCPGGCYVGLALEHEGVEAAQWLQSEGIAAFVLRYRHGPEYPHPVPLEDAQRAVRKLRHHAEEWNLDPFRVGLMGFSAGGHLAACTGTAEDSGNPISRDPVEHENALPDFLVLCYPLITMEDPLAEPLTKQTLLHENPSPELVDLLSCEKQVTDYTPPAFLWHTTEDDVAPPQHSQLFHDALKAAGVESELHLFAGGPHGLGLAQEHPEASAWPGLLLQWLEARGFG